MCDSCDKSPLQISPLDITLSLFMTWRYIYIYNVPLNDDFLATWFVCIVGNPSSQRDKIFYFIVYIILKTLPVFLKRLYPANVLGSETGFGEFNYVTRAKPAI